MSADSCSSAGSRGLVSKISKEAARPRRIDNKNGNNNPRSRAAAMDAGGGRLEMYTILALATAIILIGAVAADLIYRWHLRRTDERE